MGPIQVLCRPLSAGVGPSGSHGKAAPRALLPDPGGRNCLNLGAWHRAQATAFQLPVETGLGYSRKAEAKVTYGADDEAAVGIERDRGEQGWGKFSLSVRSLSNSCYRRAKAFSDRGSVWRARPRPRDCRLTPPWGSHSPVPAAAAPGPGQCPPPLPPPPPPPCCGAAPREAQGPRPGGAAARGSATGTAGRGARGAGGSAAGSTAASRFTYLLSLS